MRKGIIIAVSLLGGLLAGCGQQQTKATTSQSSSSSKAAATRPSRHKAMRMSNSSSTSSSRVWTSSKDSQLSSFMSSWGTTMGQDYDQYGPGNNTDFYGLKYPAEFRNGNLVANDQSATFAWSTSGSGSADYKVVAIYSDSKTAGMAAHLYLFTIHNGSPVVLITEQNQGNSENKVYFKTTANTDLSNGFAKIVNGQSASTSSSQGSTTTKQSTPKLYDMPSNMQGTWYTADDDGKVSQLTFTAHGMSWSNGSDSGSNDWYLSDGTEMKDRGSSRANWTLMESDNVDKYGTKLIHIRGWEQTAGAGSYYGVTTEDVDGHSTPVLISAGGAGAWCDSTYYRSKDTAISQGKQQFDDIDYY